MTPHWLRMIASQFRGRPRAGDAHGGTSAGRAGTVSPGQREFKDERGRGQREAASLGRPTDAGVGDPARGLVHPAEYREGLILPLGAPRRRPLLKSVAGLTVFAFTLTTLLPPGWAAPNPRVELTDSGNLRGVNIEESPDELAGLEEELKRGQPSEPLPNGRRGEERARSSGVVGMKQGRLPSLVVSFLGIGPNRARLSPPVGQELRLAAAAVEQPLSVVKTVPPPAESFWDRRASSLPSRQEPAQAGLEDMGPEQQEQFGDDILRSETERIRRQRETAASGGRFSRRTFTKGAVAAGVGAVVVGTGKGAQGQEAGVVPRPVVPSRPVYGFTTPRAELRQMSRDAQGRLSRRVLQTYEYGPRETLESIRRRVRVGEDQELVEVEPIVMDEESGTTYLPAPRAISRPLSRHIPHRYWEAFVRVPKKLLRSSVDWLKAPRLPRPIPDRISEPLVALFDRIGEQLGYRMIPEDPDAAAWEASREWDQANQAWQENHPGLEPLRGFAPNLSRDEQEKGKVTRSYTIWAPQMPDQRWWPKMFTYMRRTAGYTLAEVPRFGHSRIYLDVYGLLSPKRPWTSEDLLSFLRLAAVHGIEVVPLLGDPSMSIYPDQALYLVRDLALQKVLWPDRDGVMRVAYDIEPHVLRRLDGKETYLEALKRYQLASGDEKKRLAKEIGEPWANVIEVAARTQRLLSRRYQSRALPSYHDVEVTLFVPPVIEGVRLDELIGLAKAARPELEIPKKGVRFMVMAYGDPRDDSPLARSDDETPGGVVGLLNRMREVTQPGSESLLEGMHYGVAANLDPAKLDSTGRPVEKSFWNHMERVPATGHQVYLSQQGAPTFDQEYLAQGDFWTMQQFLSQGAPNREQRAAGILRHAWQQMIPHLAKAVDYASGIKHYPPSKYGTVDERPAQERVMATLIDLGRRFISGVFATGSLVAHWETVHDTIAYSISLGRMNWRFHPDLPLLGPDMGGVYSLGIVYNSARFGQSARITSVARIAVDPSGAGFIPLTGEGAPPDERRVRGRIRGDALHVTGKADGLSSWFFQLLVTPGRDYSVAELKARGVTHIRGALLPDGSIVPGRMVVRDDDILADSGRDYDLTKKEEKDLTEEEKKQRAELKRRRQESDARVTALRNNGYDLYYTVTVKNVGKENFNGNIRMNIGTGYGEPVQVESGALGKSGELLPGEVFEVTLPLLVGYDKDRLPIGPGTGEDYIPASRRQPDVMQRPGPLHRNALVRESILVVNTTIGFPEIAHAVGRGAFDFREMDVRLHPDRYYERQWEVKEAGTGRVFLKVPYRGEDEETIRNMPEVQALLQRYPAAQVAMKPKPIENGQALRAGFRKEVADSIKQNKLSQFSLSSPRWNQGLSVKFTRKHGNPIQFVRDHLLGDGAQGGPTRRDQHGITHLIVDAEELASLAKDPAVVGLANYLLQLRQIANRYARGPIDFSAEYYSRVMTAIGRHPSVARLRLLVAEARRQGVQVGFSLDARVTARQADGTERYGERFRDFFRVIKILTEEPEIGFGPQEESALSLTVITHFDELKRKAPDDAYWLVNLYQGAQSPLLVVGDVPDPDDPAPPPAKPVQVENDQTGVILTVGQALDLTGVDTGSAIQRLSAVPATQPPDVEFPLALLSPEQLDAAPTLQGPDDQQRQLLERADRADFTDEERKDLDALLEDASLDMNRLANNLLEVADPAWMAGQVEQLRRYLPAARRIPLDYLDLKKTVGLHTGLINYVAHQFSPDPTRAFIIQYRDRDLANDVLYAADIPALPGQLEVGPDRKVQFRIVNRKLGMHSTMWEYVPLAMDRFMAGEPQLNNVPFAREYVMRGDRPEEGRLIPLNPEMDNRVQIGGVEMNLRQGRAGEITVVEAQERKKVWVGTHRTITVGHQTLHLAWDWPSQPQLLYYWMEGDEVASALPAGAAMRPTLGGVTLAVQAQEDSGQIRVAVTPAGSTQATAAIDLWELSDQLRLATRVRRELVKQEVTEAEDEYSRIPAPAIQDLNRVIEPHTDRGQILGEASGWAAMGLAGVAAFKTLLDRTSQSWHQAVAQVRTPLRSGVTRNRVSWLGWNGRVMKFLKVTTVTLGVLFMMSQVPAVAALMGLGVSTAGLLKWAAVGVGAIAFLSAVGLMDRYSGLHLGFSVLAGAVVGVAAWGAAAYIFMALLGGLLNAPAVAPVVTALTGSVGLTNGWSFAMKFLVMAPLAVRWLVDGLGALGPEVTRLPQAFTQFLYRLFGIDHQSHPTWDTPRDAVANVIGSVQFLGDRLRALADLGRWVGRIMIGVAVLWYPFIAPASIGVAAAEVAAGVGSPTLSIAQAVWVLAQRVWVMTIGTPAVRNVVLAVVGTVWLRHAWQVGRNYREAGESFSWKSLLLRAVVPVVVSAAVMYIAAATFFPYFSLAAVGSLTVFEALKIYVAYRFIKALGRFAVEFGVEGGAFALAHYAAMRLGAPFLHAFFIASGVTSVVYGLHQNILKKLFVERVKELKNEANEKERKAWRDEIPEEGPRIPVRVIQIRKDYEKKIKEAQELANWVSAPLKEDPPEGVPWPLKILFSRELWAVAASWALAVGPLKFLATELQAGGSIANALVNWHAKAGPVVAEFLGSSTPYLLVAGLWGLYQAGQYLAALWSKSVIPLWRTVRGVRGKGVTTPMLPPPASPTPLPSRTPTATPPTGPSEAVPPGDSPAAGLEDVEVAPPEKARTREEVTRRVEAQVLRQSIQLADQALATWKTSVKSLLLEVGKMDGGSPARQLKEEFIENLVNGFALRVQESSMVAGLDIGAFLKGEETNWTLQEMFRKLEDDDGLTAVNANIDVDPAGDPSFFGPQHYYNYAGFGVVAFPLLWGSQKIQYTVAMIFRTSRGRLTEPVGVFFLYGSGVHSDMENNPEAFISLVMGRWLEGHKSIIAAMVGGKTFVLDPNRQRTTDVRLFRKQTEQVEYLRQFERDPISQVMVNYISEADDMNYDLVGMEPGIPSRRIEPQRYQGAYGGVDAESFKTLRLDSDHWAMSPRAGERLVFPPIQFRVRGGKLVAGGVGRWSLVYKEGEDHSQRKAFPKSAALSGYLELMQGRVGLAPQILGTDHGSDIIWRTVPLDVTNDQEHGLKKQEEVRAEVRETKRTAADAGRQIYFRQAKHLGADGVWYGPDELDKMPAAYEDLGPMLGHQVFDSLYGRWYQLRVRLIDWFTGRRYAVAESLGVFRDLLRKGKIWDAVRSVPYILGGPFFLLGVVALLVGWWPPSAFLWIGVVFSSSWFLEWFWRRAHEVSYWGPRKHPVQAVAQAYYNPMEVLRLTRRVTGGMAALPKGDTQKSDGYNALVEEGEAILATHKLGRRGNRLLMSQDQGTLLDLVTEYARTLSPEQRAKFPNRPAGAWRRILSRQIRRELVRAGILPGRLGLAVWAPAIGLGRLGTSTQRRLAVQRAILQIIRREHLAVGNPEAEYLYHGSHEPGIQRRGDTTRVYGEAFSDEEQLLAGDVLKGMAKAADMKIDLGRGWAWMDVGRPETSELGRRNLEPMRASTKRYTQDEDIQTPKERPPTIDWGNRAGSSFNKDYFGETFLQADTDSQVRVAAQASVEGLSPLEKLLGSQDLRYGGMVKPGPDPRHLGGFSAAISLAVIGLFGKGVLGKLGLALPSGWGLFGLAAAVIAADYILYEVAHWLDDWDQWLPSSWRSSRLVRGAKWLTRMANRVVGAAASLWVGWELFSGAMAWIAGILVPGAGFLASKAIAGGTLASLFGGTAPVIAPIVAVGVGLVAIYAALHALLAHRWDQYTHHGWRGEGIRALSLIPGLLIQKPIMIIFKAIVLTANKSAPVALGLLAGGAVLFYYGGQAMTAALSAKGVIAGLSALLFSGGLPALIALLGAGILGALLSRYLLDVPWSLDAWLVSLRNGMMPDGLTGLVDRLEHNVVMGSALVPGKLIGRLTIGWRFYSKMEANPVPALKVQMLAQEPNWTRGLSGLNLLPETARQASLGLAEDTLASWSWEVLGYEGEPVVAAFGVGNLTKQQRAYEEARDDAGSFQRAMQFAKGAGMWLAILRMSGKSGLDKENVPALVEDAMRQDAETRRKIFASVLWAVQQREQADTGEARGAGAYSFLFTSFTASMLATKLVGMFAPGEAMALAAFLYYMERDVEMSGALTRQIFQLNREQAGNPLAGQPLPQRPTTDDKTKGTLADKAVLEEWLGEGGPRLPFLGQIWATGGWAVDPRAALAMAKEAKRNRWAAIQGVGEVVDVRDAHVRVVRGLFNKVVVLPIQQVARQRKIVNDLAMYGKHRFIRLAMNWEGAQQFQQERKGVAPWVEKRRPERLAKMVLREPLGSPKGPTVVERERERIAQGAKQRTDRRTKFAVTTQSNGAAAGLEELQDRLLEPALEEAVAAAESEPPEELRFSRRRFNQAMGTGAAAALLGVFPFARAYAQRRATALMQAQGALGPLARALGPSRQIEIVVWDPTDILQLPGFFNRAVQAGVTKVWVSGFSFNKMPAAQQRAVLRQADAAGLSTIGFIDGNYDWPQQQQWVAGHYDRLLGFLSRYHRDGTLGNLRVAFATNVEPYNRQNKAVWDRLRGNLSAYSDLLEKVIVPRIIAFARANPKRVYGSALTRFEAHWFQNGRRTDEGYILKGLREIPWTTIAGMTYQDTETGMIHISQGLRGRIQEARRVGVVTYLLGAETVSVQEAGRPEVTYIGEEEQIPGDLLGVVRQFPRADQERLLGVFIHFGSPLAADRAIRQWLATPEESQGSPQPRAGLEAVAKFVHLPLERLLERTQFDPTDGLPREGLRGGQAGLEDGDSDWDRFGSKILSIPAAGLEDLRVGEPDAWMGSRGVSIGRTVPIHDDSGVLVGRALFPDPKRGGVDVSGQIRSNPPPQTRGLRPTEVTWALDRTAAFSYIGGTSEGQPVLVGVSAHQTTAQGSDLMRQLGASNALVLGGSADVHQWVRGREDSTLVAQADARSTQAGQVGRPLNAVLAGYEIAQDAAGLEQVAEPTETTFQSPVSTSTTSPVIAGTLDIFDVKGTKQSPVANAIASLPPAIEAAGRPVARNDEGVEPVSRVDQAKQTITRLSEKWGFTTVDAGAWMAAVAPDALDRYPHLQHLVGKSVQMGDGWLAILPKEAGGMSQVLLPFLAIDRPVKVTEFTTGSPEAVRIFGIFEILLRDFGSIEVVARSNIGEDLTFTDLLYQILVNVAGVDPERISPEDLAGLEQALAVLA